MARSKMSVFKNASKFLKRAFVASLLASVLGGVFVSPAHAGISSFSTSILSGTVRVMYQYGTPVPDGAMYITMTSSTDASKVWKLRLSNDAVGTYNSTTFLWGATVTFDPKSLVNASPTTCTLCVVELASGPSNWLPNGVYISQLSFHVSTGDTLLSSTGALTTSVFTMPPKITQNTYVDDIAHKNGKIIETTFPQSVLTGAGNYPNWLFTSKPGCSSNTVTITSAGGVAPNTAIKFTFEMTAPNQLNFSSTMAYSQTGTLIRGCDYSVTVFYKSSLRLPPLPDDPQGPTWASNSLSAFTLPTYPDPPTATLAPTATGGVLAFTPTFDGFSTNLYYMARVVPQLNGSDAPGVFVFMCPIATTCTFRTLPTDTTYKVYVKAVNGIGEGAEAFVDTLTLQHCSLEPSIQVDWSGCDRQGTNYSNLDFSRSNFSGANFSNANLAGVTLDGVDLSGAQFSGANFAGIHGTGILNADNATLPTGWAVVNGTLGTYSGPPANVTVTRANRKFVVSWSTPISSSTIGETGFNVRAVDGTNVFSCSNVQAMTCELDGLTPGVDYDISASSLNQAGEGASSAIQTIQAISVPGSPSAIVSPLPTGFNVAITAPSTDGFSSVTGYVVKVVPQTAEGDGAPLLVACIVGDPCGNPALPTDTTYKIFIAAENEVGLGEYALVDTLVLQHCTLGPSAQVNWSGCDRHQSDYVASDFSDANFSNANFSGANLSNANLTNVNLHGASLSNANLTGANLTGVDLGSADLTNAILTGVHGTGILNASSATLPAGWAVVDGTIGTYSGPPSDVSVTRSNRKFVVSWSTPTSTSTIGATGFNVRAVDGTNVFTCNNVQAMTCEISGLTPGTNYSVSATSLNQAGEGLSSSVQEIQAISVTDSPAITEVASRNASALITWSAPESNGGAAVMNYTVTSTPEGKSCNTTTTSCVVLDLTNGVGYTFAVTATNEAGTSAASTASRSVIPRTELAAPSSVLSVRGARSATVSWTAPTTLGYEILGYSVFSIPGNKSCTTNSTSCKVPNLTAGLAYAFRVVAITTDGVTSNFETPNTIVIGDMPGAPTKFKAVPATGSTKFTWSAPLKNGGSNITGYKVKVTPGNKTCTTVTKTTCTIRGLTKGKSYTATVTVSTALATTTVPKAVEFKAK